MNGKKWLQKIQCFLHLTSSRSRTFVFVDVCPKKKKHALRRSSDGGTRKWKSSEKIIFFLRQVSSRFSNRNSVFWLPILFKRCRSLRWPVSNRFGAFRYNLLRSSIFLPKPVDFKNFWNLLSTTEDMVEFVIRLLDIPTTGSSSMNSVWKPKPAEFCFSANCI